MARYSNERKEAVLSKLLPPYNLFKQAWARAFPEQEDLFAKAIDNLLHAARLNDDGSQRTWTARLSDLPDGSMPPLAG